MTTVELPLLLLGRGDRPRLRARRRVPGRPARGLRPRPGGARHGREGSARRPGVRARPPLPARRGDPVRRRHRRLVQAGARRGRPAGGGVHRLLRRALHGRVRRHPHRARAAGGPARPRGRLLDGRHGRASPRSRTPGTRSTEAGVADVDRAGDLHELLRRHQGVLRPARRRGLHLVQRPGGAGVGLRSRGRTPRCCSCPTSTSAATPPCWRWASRSTTAWSTNPHKPRRRAHRRAAARRQDDPLAGALLGARPVHRRRASTTCARRVPGVNVLVHPECRHEVVLKADLVGSTEYIIKTDRGRAGRLRVGDRHRAQPGAAAGARSTRTSRSCSWTRPSATARR